MIKIAREGYKIIVCFIIITALIFCLSLILPGFFSPILKTASLLLLILSVFSLYFFRDPERVSSSDASSILSPADGTIIDIREVFEPRYLNSKAVRISIFMSVFNVHVNRSPVDGKIEFLEYNKGKFISAFKEKASDDNESIFAGISCTDFPAKLAVKFIAGLIARRIVFYKETGAVVGRAERINIIKFGSRVDIYCPLSCEIKVKYRDRVYAGLTVIGNIK